MRRVLGLWLCTLLVLGVVAFRSSGGTAVADETDDATIAALGTKVAKQATSIAKRDAKIDQLRTRIAEMEGEQAVGPTETPQPEEASNEGAESSTLGGNALELLPGGGEDEFGVVAVGPYNGNILPIVLRNNTDEDLSDVTVSAVARSTSGELIAAGGDQGFNPNVVLAGSYTLGYIYFDGIALPAEAAFEFDVSGETYTGPGSFSRIDLAVTEAAFLGDRIVGEFENTSDLTVTGPIGISIVCFGADGSIFGFEQGYSDKDEAAPGETVPFQVSFYSGIDCTNFLVAGSGFNF
jgi:hypothetical protein